MLSLCHTELLDEYGEDLEKLCDGFLKAREEMQQAQEEIRELESTIGKLVDKLSFSTL